MSKPFGLVLCGGRSRRMGRDKALMSYNELPQYLHVASLMKPFCQDIFFSVHKGQNLPGVVVERQIVDREDDQGPAGGLFSAHELAPANDWLVLAVDMPGVGTGHFKRLVVERWSVSGECDMIMYEGQPLVSLWSSRALKKLAALFGGGERKLFRIVNQLSVRTIPIENELDFLNVNCPKDLD